MSRSAKLVVVMRRTVAVVELRWRAYEMGMMRPLVFITLCVLLACGSNSTDNDATGSGGSTSSGGQGGSGGGLGGGGLGGDGGMNAAGSGGGGGGASSCLAAGHQAGERYSLLDNCNFCDCMADGTSECTQRSCPAAGPGCTYDAVDHGYGERFAATDGVNECVCAASGLACTRRDPNLPEEGAILLESLSEACGDDANFTGAAVLTGMPTNDVTTAFPYNTTGALYPETLPDTTMRLRIVYDDGFVVCRIQSPTQHAIDIEAVVEWMTADGSFDEGHHTYLRRNNFGFVDAWLTVGSAPHGGLDGTYDPNCLDPRGTSFSAQVNADGTVEGFVGKICEIDTLLDVGRFMFTP